MARTMIVSAITAAVVALAFTLLAPRPGPKSDDSAAISTGSAELDARLDALEDHVESLGARLDARGEAAEAEQQPASSVDEETFQPMLRNLASESENTVFAATLELGNMKDRRAIASLVEVLRTHSDYYVRLGAATALGEIGAVDAVPALIDALGDADELVRTAAGDALEAITRENIVFLAGASESERAKAQEAWRRWWADHEDRLEGR